LTDRPFNDATVARPDAAPSGSGSRFAPGSMLAGRYRIVALLGRGGMGEVYRAEDTKLGHPVALKFLPRELTADRKTLDRLFAEVRIGRQVSHPNVCRLYDIGESDEGHFITMEYVDGEDLASLLRRIGRLPADKALDIARDLSAGLAAAHDVGIVHRDLKPANVMIDGRGRARITDFGLAGVAQELQNEGAFAGTPAYMAPEQLSGGQVTPRSDLYALGLILYEVFTGKRLFGGSSLEEIRSQHRIAKPPSISSMVREIDPAIERVILRCLDDDPAARPSSAHAVIASLPGGDPLAAAVAAGETPSPAMVAAAGKIGDLQPAVAWPLLILALVGPILIAAMAARTTLFNIIPLPKSPEVLDARGQEIAQHLGYTDAPASTARWWIWNSDYRDYMAKRDQSPNRWKRMARLRPGIVLYAFRQSMRPMIAWNNERLLADDDPPLIEQGMLRVMLDPNGRLTEFVAVPLLKDERASVPTDWNALFREADIDPGRFHPVRSIWSAPVDTDEKRAWDGTLAEQPDVPLHVEAGAHRGRPVWFSVFGPWNEPPPLRGRTRRLTTILSIVSNMIFQVGMVVMFAILAVGNLRRGRGDQKGATRLAIFCFVVTALARLLRADHTFSPEEWELIETVLAWSAYYAVTVWLGYIALEPYVRRRLPHTLISWSRLLSGRFRDPMVGRDVLIGTIAGAVLIAFAHLQRLVPAWIGMPPPGPIQFATSTLVSVRHVGYFLLYSIAAYVIAAIALTAGVVITRPIVRSQAVAVAIVFVFLTVAFFAGGGESLTFLIIFAALSAAALMFVMIRWGLLAMAVMGIVFGWLRFIPMTLDTTAWYAGRSFFVMGLIAALAIFGFFVALAGKPLFGKPLLEEG
jgi:hypothetical protein